MARRRIRPFRRRWLAAALLVVAGMVIVIARAALLTWAASALIVEHALRPAAAIVVLGGEAPFRQMEAAELYRQGWAPEVILSREADSEGVMALRAIGIHQPSNAELGERALIQLGVPREAVTVLPRPAVATLDELQQVFESVSARGQPVILVTTRIHTRRVGHLWQLITRGTVDGIVRPASRDPFDVNAWWRRRSDALAVTREYMSLANQLLRRPVRA